MKITFDPAKRQETLEARGLDFEDAAAVFAGTVFTFEDARKEYGETRLISVGHLAGRMVVICWTERDDTRRVISMRKANEREQEVYRQRLGEG